MFRRFRSWPKFVSDEVVLWQETLPKQADILNVHFTCMCVACLLVGLALAYIADRAINMRTMLDVIVRLQEASRDLLVLASTTLIVGVTGTSLFNQIVIATLQMHHATVAQTVSLGSTTLFAVFYSTLIITSFGPVEFVLRKVAAAHARALGHFNVTEYLSQHGFANSAPSIVVRAVAAAAPILASFAQTWF